MKAFDYAEKKDVDNTLKCLIPKLDIEISNKVDLINAIFTSLHKIDKSTGKKTIDFKKDYRLIWDSFKSKRQIDLNVDNINWWEFNAMLEGLFLEGDSSICKVIEYRTMSIPKADKYNRDYIAFIRRMKTKYRLLEDNANEGLGNLFNYLNKKVGGKNG